MVGVTDGSIAAGCAAVAGYTAAVVTQAARQLDGWLSGVPLHPWLFAAYPVIRLYSVNLADVEPGEVVLPLVLVLAATTIGMAGLTMLLHDGRRAAVIVSAVVVPALSFGVLLDVLSDALGLGRLALLALSAALLGVAVLVAVRIRGQLGALTSALNIISAALLLFVAIPAAAGVADVLATSTTQAETTTVVLGSEPATPPTRDIYHLILDRYGSERALDLGYGIDNSGFVAWLREQGFQVLDDSHANYSWTTLSLASTLGMRQLDDVSRSVGPAGQNLGPAVERIRKSRAGATLQDLGYEYIHLGSYYNRTRQSSIADQVINPVDEVTFASTLDDLTILPELTGRDAQTMERPEMHAAAARFQFDVLDELRDRPGPQYVLAHFMLPHPPYIFLEDGSVDRGHATFESQLAYTNRRLREFLEPLLALPEDERPIIILQGDEGPYPRRLAQDDPEFTWPAATEEELVTKYGILNAWYQPGPEGEAPLSQDMTALRTYPELLRRYFGVAVDPGPEHIYASDRDRPLALTDITDRLEAAESAVASEEGPGG